ncbi:MAG: internal scaffolding protein [Microviridae sp.]|nr:MAG: internal scaffolding protein [Microviridae sp.]
MKKVVTPFLRTPYNYDMNAAGDEDALHCKDPSLTKQSFVEESDINTIVKRFGLTGELPKNVRQPEYGDFSQVVDFHTAMTAIRHSQEAFYSMPANVRARFHNDPGEFVDFCLDDNNRQEAEKLGLVQKPATPDPQKTDPNGSVSTVTSSEKTVPPRSGGS